MDYSVLFDGGDDGCGCGSSHGDDGAAPATEAAPAPEGATEEAGE